MTTLRASADTTREASADAANSVIGRASLNADAGATTQERRQTMTKTERIIAALILAVIMAAGFFVGDTVTKIIITHIPAPWDNVVLGVMAFALLTLMVYIFISKFTVKEGDDHE